MTLLRRWQLAFAAIFFAVIVFLVLIAYAGFEIVSSTRAYVNGEALWSKAQKDAVNELTEYALTGDEKQYQQFLHSVSIPVCSGRALEELKKPVPDMTVVHTQLLAAGSDPADLDRIVRFFRWFHNSGHFAQAVTLWKQGGPTIKELVEMGKEVHSAGKLSPAAALAVVRRADRLNHEFTDDEINFSNILSNAARFYETRVMEIIGAVAILLFVGTGWVSAFMVRRIEESERRYRNLIETDRDAIVVTDQQSGRIVDVNRKAAEITGRSIDELIGVKPGEMFQLSRVMAADGRVVPVEMNTITTRIGGRTLRMDVYRDVTEHRKNEAALRDSEERYRYLYENANDILYTHDLSGRITSINKVVTEELGYSSTEAEGLHVLDVIRPADREMVKEAFRESRCGEEKSINYEVGVQAKDGRVLWLEVRTSVLRQAGKPVGALGIGRDVTERHIMQEQLRESNRELAKALRVSEAAADLKSQFLANVSHEIRTPMNGIIGMNNLLLDTHLTNEQHEYVEIIRISADGLLGIIDNILDFSKIEAGKLPLERRDFSVLRLVEDVGRMLRYQAVAKGLDFDVIVSPGIPEVAIGDPARLRQVLINLVGNAVKFTDEGRVTMEAELVGESEGGCKIRFSVSDTGMGIPTEDQERIFDSFVQADVSSTRRHGGAGLGLTISKQLVGMMGGDIEVASEVGRGSTFAFTVQLGKSV